MRKNEVHPTIQRLEAELQRQNKKRADFLKEANIESQKYNNWRHRGIPSARMYDIAKFVGLRHEYLLSGEGPKYHSAERQRLITIEQSVVQAGVKEAGAEYISPKPCPILARVPAGDFAEAIEDKIGEFLCPVSHSDATFILIVHGQSMSPLYQDGDYIYIDPHEQPKHNSDIIVRIDNSKDATFKRLQIVDGKYYIKPINPSWPEQIIEINEDATIVGVVIFAGKDPRKKPLGY